MHQTIVFLHKSNIELIENRKLYVSKHLYEGDFKIMPIYNDFFVTLNKKEKNLKLKALN